MKPGSTGDDVKGLIREYYDGYSWDGKTRVCNPWAISNFFRRAVFFCYWYDSGSPNLLFELINNRKPLFNFSEEVRGFSGSRDFTGDISLLDPIVLMFQTGYLTVRKELINKGLPSEYCLTFPNLEVKRLFVPRLLGIKSPKNSLLAQRSAKLTRDCLFALNLEGLEQAFGTYLEQYLTDKHFGDGHFETEKYYQTLFESAMMFADQAVEPQELTARGRQYFHLKGPDRDDYIIKIKLFGDPKPKSGLRVPPRNNDEIVQAHASMESPAQEALDQITAKYAGGFQGGSTRVLMIALVVSGLAAGRPPLVVAKFQKSNNKPS
jgi:hypothetical protein